jgi:hypothetical protein
VCVGGGEIKGMLLLLFFIFHLGVSCFSIRLWGMAPLAPYLSFRASYRIGESTSGRAATGFDLAWHYIYYYYYQGGLVGNCSLPSNW